MRIGHGYDVHRLQKGKKLILGGVEIKFDKGLQGHSDADVLTHAIMDSILGAAGLFDIGKYFPDNDKKYKNANSIFLLSQIIKKIKLEKFRIINIDSTVIAQQPKLSPYIVQMQVNLASACLIDINQINVKATTEEGLGFTGKQKGIAAHAICLLEEV